MKNKTIFFDNQYLKSSAALIESLAPWHLPGKGLFETMRIYKGGVVLEGEHINRLLRGLAKIKIKHRFTEKEISLRLAETIQKNGRNDGRLRLCVWHDGKIHISVVAQEYEAFTEERYKKGFSVKSFCMEENEGALTSGFKTIPYGPFREYYLRAQNLGFDEAVLCNKDGSVVEASRANIFWVSRGVIYTPALETGCLCGITRGAVFSLAGNHHLTVRNVAAPVEKVIKGEEAFLTNSLMDIMPLTKIDGHKIGAGEPGSLTILLRDSYHKRILERGPH